MERAPELLIQRVTISNMMDYSPQWHFQAMNGKLQNLPLNKRLSLTAQTHQQSQGCHSSHCKAQEAIPFSPTLAIWEQYEVAKFAVGMSCNLPGHLKVSFTSTLICIIICIFLKYILLQPFHKNIFVTAQCNKHCFPSSICKAECWNSWRSNKKSAIGLGEEPGS